MEDRVHRYMDRLEPYLIKDYNSTTFNKDMNIESIQFFLEKNKGSNPNKKDTRVRKRTFKEGHICGVVYAIPK